MSEKRVQRQLLIMKDSIHFPGKSTRCYKDILSHKLTPRDMAWLQSRTVHCVQDSLV